MQHITLVLGFRKRKLGNANVCQITFLSSSQIKQYCHTRSRVLALLNTKTRPLLNHSSKFHQSFMRKV